MGQSKIFSEQSVPSCEEVEVKRERHGLLHAIRITALARYFIITTC